MSQPHMMLRVIAVFTLATGSTSTSFAQWPPAPTTSLPPGSPSPAPYGSMQAGGLTPPAPMPNSIAPGSGQTEQQLENAKKQDSGRGLEFVWLNVEGGFQQIGLQTFTTNDQKLTGGFVKSSSSGGVIGAGVGARLLFLTLGARGRIGFFSDYRTYSVGPEVGFHIPLGSFEPYVNLGGGYVTLGGVKGALGSDAGAASIRGFYARAGGGLDYYLTPVFSLGLSASWELLGLTRPGLGLDQLSKLRSSAGTSPADARAAALAADGSSFGSALAITGVAGLHF